MNRKTILKVFSELRQRLFRQTASLLGSQEDAEDILQDCFCKLWNKPPGQDDSEAPGIMAATARNMAIDLLRKRWRRDTVAMEGRNPVADETDMEAEERERRFLLIDQAIEAQLTPLQRQVIQLREFEGRSYAEIARKLQMSETAVRMNISRARQRIRTYYLQNFRQ